MQTAANLYLTFDVAGTDAGVEDALAAALDAADFKCVLFRGAGRLPADLGQRLVSMAQQRGLAALVADDTTLARALNADGVHLAWNTAPLEHYQGARRALGGEAMIGADAGRSRHDAMELGEAGATYVAFGIPAHVADRATAEARQRELVAWWSEIFEVPVVACDVDSEAQAGALATAGADFVAVGIASDMRPDAIAADIRRFAAAIAGVEVPA